MHSAQRSGALRLARRGTAAALAALLATGVAPVAAFAQVQDEASGATAATAADAVEYDRANLPDGTYDIGVALNQAASPDTASMAGASVSDSGRLVVEDGAYTVTVTLQTMQVMGIYGDITALYYYPSAYVQDGTAFFQGNAVLCDVLTMRTAEHDGAEYPETVSVPVQQSAIQDGYIMVAVTTTGMSDGSGGPATVNAVLKLDWEAFDAQYGPQDPVIDKAALADAVSAAQTIEQGSAASPDWALLQQAIASAQAVAADEAATQDAVDAAVAELQAAADRFNGVAGCTFRSGYSYTMPTTWYKADGTASTAGNFFADTAEVRLAEDGGYRVRIATTPASDAYVSGVTYGEDGRQAAEVQASGDAGVRQFEVLTDAVTRTVKVSFTLQYNGSTISQSGYVLLDTSQAVEAADETEPDPTPEPEPGPTPDPEPAAAFDDVAESAWYYATVHSAVSRGYMNGYEDKDESGVGLGTYSSFGPEDGFTRGQAACVLLNISGASTEGLASTFSDVDSGAYYAGAVAWAQAVGAVNGYPDGTFAPGNAITREEWACMLYNYAQRVDGSDPQAADVDAALSAYSDGQQVSGFAREAVAWAVEQGIMGNNPNGTLNATDGVTRAEVAAMAVNFREAAAG